MQYQRILNLPILLKKKSHFLFGPRSTGKTTLYESQLKNYRLYDLLDDETYLRLYRRPKLIEEENQVNPQLIIIDEIQKLPKLLDEVHRLIKKYDWHFLLTGSSARKLKRGGANMLGGRAWETHLFPLCSAEISDFNLLKYLNRGGLPFIYNSTDYRNDLKNYINVYLKEEIMAAGLVKNHDYFMSFLDVIAISNGHEINYESISRDAGVPPRTVLNYVQILQDTLMCYQLKPYQKTKSRKAISKSKLYLFDVGVSNYLAKRGEIINGGELFGPTFEHFIVNEIKCYLNYQNIEKELCFYRTTDQLEVDCIIGDDIAIEIKSTTQVNNNHCKNLKELMKEKLFKRYIVVSQDPNRRILEEKIEIIPWDLFLKDLWQQKI